MRAKNITVGPGRFTVLNDSAGPKMVTQIPLNLMWYFLKVLELFEYRRGNPYMTANGNFVRFAHSNKWWVHQHEIIRHILIISQIIICRQFIQFSE